MSQKRAKLIRQTIASNPDLTPEGKLIVHERVKKARATRKIKSMIPKNQRIGSKKRKAGESIKTYRARRKITNERKRSKNRDHGHNQTGADQPES